MNVVLKEDVISLGIEGDIVNVADGYARNYLIPKGFVVQATAGVLKDLEFRKKAIAKKEEKRKADSKKKAKKFEGKTIKLSVKTNEEGHLYGSINVGEVAEAIEKQVGQSVDKGKLVLTDHIKEVGTYPVTIRIHPQVNATLELEVSGSEVTGDKASE